MIESFHLLRPSWLLALFPLAALLWLMWHGARASRSWRGVIDPKLLPFLLAGGEQEKRHWSVILSGLAGLLSIVALAGPVWNKLPQPVFSQQAALVIALDLSASMDANDIKPDRIIRARHKIADILNLRDEGQTALLVYAAEAFAVTPLTEDSETIKSLLPRLNTEMMPAQGSRADKALQLAYALLENAGVAAGDILIVSDGLTPLELNAIEAFQNKLAAHRVSVLAIGTEEGGPIPLKNGGFLKDRDGAIVIAKLAANELRELARTNNGLYRVMSTDDDDINDLSGLFQNRNLASNARASDLEVSIWREQGPWLLLCLLPLGLFVFRRGVLLVLPLLIMPYSGPADAFEWSDLWQNDNQQASRLFEQEKHAEAAERFSQKDWKASAYFRSGDYQKALEYWSGRDNETALYNQGNALAKLDKLTEAIESYDRVLEKNPQHKDALHNKKLLEEAIKQQQQNQQSDQNSEQDKNQDSDQQQQSQEPNQQSQQESESDQAQQESESDQAQESEAERQDENQQQSDQSQQQAEKNESEQAQAEAEESLVSAEEKMSEQAAEQWLRKIPDDPGELLRRKFLYQYRQLGEKATESNPW